MPTALILVDIQNDYFPGGRMVLEGADAAGAAAGGLLAAFRRRGLPVVHVQHESVRPGATFFLPGTPGMEIHPCVAPLPGEAVVRKNFPNSFRETGLLERLRALGASELAIAGMMTHMCIDTTTRAAADLGFSVRLAHDACATKALTFGGTVVPAAQVHAAFVAALDGAFAKAVRAEELAASLPGAPR